MRTLPEFVKQEQFNRRLERHKSLQEKYGRGNIPGTVLDMHQALSRLEQVNYTLIMDNNVAISDYEKFSRSIVALNELVTEMGYGDE